MSPTFIHILTIRQTAQSATCNSATNKLSDVYKNLFSARFDAHTVTLWKTSKARPTLHSSIASSNETLFNRIKFASPNYAFERKQDTIQSYNGIENSTRPTSLGSLNLKHILSPANVYKYKFTKLTNSQLLKTRDRK